MLGDNTAPGDAFEQHVSRVQQAERDGFSTAWFAQTFGLDTLTFAALLAPKMLAIAGSVGDGTITWMTGPKTLREHIIPRLRAAAAEAGRRRGWWPDSPWR